MPFKSNSRNAKRTYQVVQQCVYIRGISTTCTVMMYLVTDSAEDAPLAIRLLRLDFEQHLKGPIDAQR